MFERSLVTQSSCRKIYFCSHTLSRNVDFKFRRDAQGSLGYDSICTRTRQIQDWIIRRPPLHWVTEWTRKEAFDGRLMHSTRQSGQNKHTMAINSTLFPICRRQTKNFPWSRAYKFHTTEGKTTRFWHILIDSVLTPQFRLFVSFYTELRHAFYEFWKSKWNIKSTRIKKNKFRSWSSYLHLSFDFLSPFTLNWDMPSMNSENTHTVKKRFWHQS